VQFVKLKILHTFRTNMQSNSSYLLAKTQFVHCAVGPEIGAYLKLTRLQHVLAMAQTASRQHVVMA
jgi:hypothetical protein